MKKERRYDLDWIRVIVFDLLILYHVGMFFVPWAWHIKNNNLSEGFVLPMVFLNQWRLPILFVVSGMGTCFALSIRKGNQYIVERSARLLLPLVFGILIIVPPQVYIERVTAGAVYSSFLNFYPDYFNGIYPKGNFSWHHLWFLPYLYCFSILLIPVFLFLRHRSETAFFKKFHFLLGRNPLSLYLFTLPLILVQIVLSPLFPITLSLIGDWYTVSLYSILFLYGFIFISIKSTFWESVVKIRFVSLSLGVVFFILLIWGLETEMNHVMISVVKIVNLWSWILTIFGFSSKYLNRSSKVLSYRNKAVYPLYILHQTVTIIIGFHLVNLEWSISLKFLLMTVGTFGFCWLIYELIIMRVKIFKSLFGLKGSTVRKDAHVKR